MRELYETRGRWFRVRQQFTMDNVLEKNILHNPLCSPNGARREDERSDQLHYESPHRYAPFLSARKWYPQRFGRKPNEVTEADVPVVPPVVEVEYT